MKSLVFFMLLFPIIVFSQEKAIYRIENIKKDQLEELRNDIDLEITSISYNYFDLLSTKAIEEVLGEKRFVYSIVSTEKELKNNLRQGKKRSRLSSNRSYC